MRKILLSMFFILSISCVNSSVNNPTQPQPIEEGKEGYTLKISSIYFDESGLTKNEANSLVNIYMSVGSAEGKLYTMAEFAKGIKVPKGSNVTLKVIDFWSEDETKEYSDYIMWQGYRFEDASYVTNKEIEILANRNIRLTLIVTDTGKEIKPEYLYLSVDTDSTSAYVKVNDNIYSNGFYDLAFLAGQKISMEAVIPNGNKNIEFRGFTTGSDVDLGPIVKYSIPVGGLSIAANFIDKQKSAIRIKISGIDPSMGDIQLHSSGTTYTNISAENIKDGVYQFPEQASGAKIRIKAVPKEDKSFVNWSDTLTGYLSSDADLIYEVKKNAEIIPSFVNGTGAVVVNISPRIDYPGYQSNFIGYKVKREGVYVPNLASVNYSGISANKVLTWQNSTIEGLQNDDIIELEAFSGEGFYPTRDNNGLVVKDANGDNIIWSGDITGTGATNSITLSGGIKSASVNFKIETRDVRIDLKRLLKIGDANPEDISQNAKGYRVILNGIEYIEQDTIVKTFPWHEKIILSVEPGIHYNAGSIQNIAVGSSYYAETDLKTKIVYDLRNDNTNVVNIIHKTVNMSLQTKGGSFDDASESRYRAFIIITNNSTGIDSTHTANNYYDGVSYANYGSATTVNNVLSGIPIWLVANTSRSTVFKNYNSSISGLVAAANSTNNVIAITNTGGNFDVKADFVSPKHVLSVNLRNFASLGVPEGSTNTIAGNAYTVRGENNNVTSSFILTNGIPVVITAIPNEYYTLSSLAGQNNNSYTLAISNDKSVDIDFLHKVSTNKLRIYGGRDDRYTGDYSIQRSHVTIANTGIPDYNKTYYANSRNISLSGKITNAYTEYEFNALAGLVDKVVITAVSSSIHNFHKMYVGDNNLPDGTGLKSRSNLWVRGPNTYNKTNWAIIDIPNDNKTIVNVDFRINSYQGSMNGLSGNELNEYATANDMVITPKIVSGTKYYDIYTASQLAWLTTTPLNENDIINLKSDIYFGSNSEFKGFKSFKSTFLGNNYAIFDLNIPYQGFIHEANGALIKGLTVARGAINFEGNSRSGLIGVAVNSKIQYATNAAISVGKTNSGVSIGGIVGWPEPNNTIEYVANYANVYGSRSVGGVFGGWYNLLNINYIVGKHDMKRLFNAGYIEGKEEVGGIIGTISINNNSSAIEFSEFANIGNVRAISGGAGGILGYSGGGNIKFINGYNTGSVVSAPGNALARTSGGFAGYYQGIVGMNVSVVRNVYNIGSISSMGSRSYAGKLYGQAGFRKEVYPYTTYTSLDNYNFYSYVNDNIKYVSEYHPYGSNTTELLSPNLLPISIYIYTNSGSYYMVRFTSSYEDLNKIMDVSPSTLNTSKTGFEDTSIWVQSVRPPVNGFTSRPTLKNLPEMPIHTWVTNE